MSIVATSPLASITVSVPVSIELGDNSVGFTWDIPPGSIIPPGMHLNTLRGTLYGVPTIPGSYSFYIREKNTETGLSTQREFLISVVNSEGQSEASIQQIVTQAFQLNKAFSGQNVWFEESLDAQGRKVYAIKINDDGQIRTLSSITIA